jgi:hypothetical protein
LVCTSTSTGRVSRQLRTSGHDTISVLSIVVGATVGASVGAADVGADVGGRGVVVAVVVPVVVSVVLGSNCTPPPQPQHASIAETPPIGA